MKKKSLIGLIGLVGTLGCIDLVMPTFSGECLPMNILATDSTEFYFDTREEYYAFYNEILARNMRGDLSLRIGTYDEQSKSAYLFSFDNSPCKFRFNPEDAFGIDGFGGFK